MKMKDYYMAKFGEFFGESEAAPAVYANGWNDALTEAARRIGAMPFGNDTKASFAVFFKQLQAPLDTRYTDDSK
jgi:hypothetical protein